MVIRFERVARVQRGVYVPVVQHPEARLVSLTVLPDGTVKLEIGDDHVLTLTPREARSVGVTLGGLAAQAASIEAGHQAALMASKSGSFIEPILVKRSSEYFFRAAG